MRTPRPSPPRAGEKVPKADEGGSSFYISRTRCVQCGERRCRSALATAVAVTALLAFDVPYAIELPAARSRRSGCSRRTRHRDGRRGHRRALPARDRPLALAAGRPGATHRSLAAAGARGGRPRRPAQPIRVPATRCSRAAMKRIPTAAVSVLVENEEWLDPRARAARAATRRRARQLRARSRRHPAPLRRHEAERQLARTPHSRSRRRRCVRGTPRRSASPSRRRSARRRATIPRVSADRPAPRPDTRSLRSRNCVFLGPTALGLGDRVLTPVSAALAPDPGVTVHAAATESLLRGERIHDLPPIVGGARWPASPPPRSLPPPPPARASPQRSLAIAPRRLRAAGLDWHRRSIR